MREPSAGDDPVRKKLRALARRFSTHGEHRRWREAKLAQRLGLVLQHNLSRDGNLRPR